MKQNKQIILKQTNDGVRNLYDRYAGMLLGYLFEIVKDHQLAEQYLVDIFNVIPQQYNEITRDGANTWCQLQRIAKARLASYFDGKQAPAFGDFDTGNKFLALMTGEQRQVFCSVYYQGKTVAGLAKALNNTEDHVRKVLKEAFAIMRRGA